MSKLLLVQKGEPNINSRAVRSKVHSRLRGVGMDRDSKRLHRMSSSTVSQIDN